MVNVIIVVLIVINCSGLFQSYGSDFLPSF